MSPLIKAIHDAMPVAAGEEWVVFEHEAEGQEPNQGTSVEVITPDFEMPEDDRERLRKVVDEVLPAAQRTLIFKH